MESERIPFAGAKYVRLCSSFSVIGYSFIIAAVNSFTISPTISDISESFSASGIVFNPL